MVNQITLRDYWKVLYADIDDNGALPLNTNGNLLSFLLSERNINAGQLFFNMSAVERTLKEAALEGKDGFVAKGDFYDVFSEDQQSQGFQYCPTEGVSANKNLVSWRIDKEVSSIVLELDDKKIRCTKESPDEYIAIQMSRLVQSAASNLAASVEKEIFARNAAGDYKYIGNYPTRNGTARPAASEQLNLFRDQANAYNALNPVAENYFEEDMSLAGIGTDYVIFGGSLLWQYLAFKGITAGVNQDGYNNALKNNINTQRYFRSDIMTQAVTGLPDAMLALRAGAVQIATKNQFEGHYEYSDGQHSRGTVEDPYFNLTWDVVENVVKCGAEIKRYIQLRLFYGILGYPSCLDGMTPYRQGVKDVFLYQIGCGDTNVCTLTKAARTPETSSSEYIEVCAPKTVCENPLACTAGLSLQYFDDGSGGFNVRATAGAFPPIGTASITYAWTLEAVALPETSNILTLTVDDYTDGDVIGLTITYLDADGNSLCDPAATATAVIATP